MQRLYTNCRLPLSGQTAFAVENGRFSTPRPRCGDVTDLQGAFVLPAFLDAHSHLLAYALSLLQADGARCTAANDLIAAAERFAREEELSPRALVTVKNVDALPEGDALDDCPRPLHIQHPSGHAGAFNAAAARLLGLPRSGIFREAEYLAATRRVPMPAPEAAARAFARARTDYLSRGTVLAQEGYLSRELFPLCETLLQTPSALPVVAYCAADDYDEARRRFAPLAAHGLSVGGIKIFLDGSPQLKTAFLRRPYRTGGQGEATMTERETAEACRFAAARGAQLLAHCNGDGAIERFLNALEGLSEAERRAIRPVVIHAQLMGDDQLDRAARLGAVPSFFPAHIKYWGETHISNLGRARAARISPAKSALLRGIPFTLHQDTPVCPPSPLEAVSCAVARRTQSGRRFACQAIDVREALEAVTRNVAAQYGFADRGAIRPGYRADFIVLDDDPLACPPEALASLRAAAVYRDGECVFRA